MHFNLGRGRNWFLQRGSNLVLSGSAAAVGSEQVGMAVIEVHNVIEMSTVPVGHP